MSEVVERAAIAAHEKGLELARKEGVNYSSWDGLSVETKARFIECQRAAIEAMRDPTAAMIKAAREAEIAYDQHECIPPRLAWPAMIDELLRD
jgi:hypothetical protein